MDCPYIHSYAAAPGVLVHAGLLPSWGPHWWLMVAESAGEGRGCSGERQGIWQGASSGFADAWLQACLGLLFIVHTP